MPVLNEDLRAGGQLVNRLDAQQDSKWVLSRRFFLADRLREPGQSANFLLRVPVHMSLHVHIQVGAGDFTGDFSSTFSHS